MSEAVIDRLETQFGQRLLEKSAHFGDHEVVVATTDWVEVATFLKDDGELRMDHFIDLTAIVRNRGAHSRPDAHRRGGGSRLAQRGVARRKLGGA